MQKCPPWTLSFPSLPSPSQLGPKPRETAVRPGLSSSPVGLRAGPARFPWWRAGRFWSKFTRLCGGHLSGGSLCSGITWRAAAPLPGWGPHMRLTGGLLRRSVCGKVVWEPFGDCSWLGRAGPQEAGAGGRVLGLGPGVWPGLCLGGGLLPSLALRVCLLLASPPFFPGTCRCFRRQSQGAEEGRASAHVLQGGL